MVVWLALFMLLNHKISDSIPGLPGGSRSSRLSLTLPGEYPAGEATATRAGYAGGRAAGAPGLWTERAVAAVAFYQAAFGLFGHEREIGGPLGPWSPEHSGRKGDARET
jgi:hypothetical protein